MLTRIVAAGLLMAGVHAHAKKFIVDLKGIDADQIFQDTKIENLKRLELGIVDSESAELISDLRRQGINVVEDISIPLPKLPIDISDFDPKRNIEEKVSTPWGLTAIHAPSAWQTGHQGEGVKVLVVDSGVDRDHPSLKGKVVAGASFVTSSPGDPYPYIDKFGHGTHVAGTILGKAIGVAPKAKLYVGKACDESACPTSAIFRAINWGLNQGVQVINISLGSQTPSPLTQSILRRAQDLGVVVVAAAGNDGINRVSFPAAFEETIAVGAVDSEGKRAVFSQFGKELDIVAPGVEVYSAVPRGTGIRNELIFHAGSKTMQVPVGVMFQGAKNTIKETAIVDGDLAISFDEIDVQGKLVLVKRGEISFKQKMLNAQKAGAIGVVMYNNNDKAFSATLGRNNGVTIPAVTLDQANGEQLQKFIGMYGEQGRFLKFTMIVEKSDYVALQGTSMASPHVAGVVALVLGKNPKLSPNEVLQKLKESATKKEALIPFELGSGVVDAQKALN